MCVKETGLPWERHASPEDCEVLSIIFPGIDFTGIYRAMNVHGFRPVPTDLVLLGGLFSSMPDDAGVRSVPFSGFDPKRREIVKLHVMRGIVEWMENSALGTAMWRSVSEWTMRTRGTVIEFTMKCNCIEVPLRVFHGPEYGEWLECHHASRADTVGVFGRSGLPQRSSIRGTDITPDQFAIWKKMRFALERLSLGSSEVAA
jgi:hypothetical protein